MYASSPQASGPARSPACADEDRWFGPGGSRERDARLFCFPFAGGGTANYRNWQNWLPDLDVRSVRLPGREMRIVDAPLESLSVLVPRLADAIAGLLDRPYAFFGHSMGGLIAFELVREIERRGLRGPSRLFVSARHAPGASVADSWRHAPDLPDDRFVEFLGDLAPGTRDLLADESLRAVMLPVLRADFRLCGSPPPAGTATIRAPIVSLAGNRDPHVQPADMARWSGATVGSLEQHVVDGDHFFLTSMGGTVAALVGDVLSAAFAPLATDVVRGQRDAASRPLRLFNNTVK